MFLTVSVAVHLALLLLFVGNPTLSATLLAGYVVYHALVAWGIMYPRSRLFGPNLYRLPTNERIVALTFDDGPHPVVTPRVLAILRSHGVRATFFLIGKWAERHQEIVRQIVADGHTLGNHSQEHSYAFWALPPAPLFRDVQAAQRGILAASGSPCCWFRPPVGLKSCFLPRVLGRLGLRHVSWDLRFLDRCAPSRERLSRRLRRRIAPGSIVLLHDGHDRKPEGNPHVVTALPVLLELLEEMGYRCVPLSEDMSFPTRYTDSQLE